MKKIAFILALVFCMVVFNSEGNAKRVKSHTANKLCKMVEQATVNVTFNEQVFDIKNIKTEMPSKIDRIKTLAKDIGLEEIELQNMNYSSNSNSNNNNDCNSKKTFNFYGNTSFKIKPADKASDLVLLLTDNGYNANLNMNAYRQCQ